jgi:hypothetical protein
MSNTKKVITFWVCFAIAVVLGDRVGPTAGPMFLACVALAFALDNRGKS